MQSATEQNHYLIHDLGQKKVDKASYLLPRQIEIHENFAQQQKLYDALY